MQHFNNKVYGYFQIPVPGNDAVRLHLNVVWEQAWDTPFKSVLIVEHEQGGDDRQCALIKRNDESIRCIGATEFLIPDPSNLRYTVSVEHKIKITNSSRFVFWANGYKYWAKCRIVDLYPCEKSTSEITLIIPCSSGPSVLDTIEGLKHADMKSFIKQDQSKTSDVVVAAPIKTAETAETAEIKLDLRIKRGKCVGAPCWVMPRGISCALKLTVDEKIATRTDIRLAAQNTNGMLSMNSFYRYKGTNDIRVPVGVSKFWLIDNNDEVVDFEIKAVNFE